MNYIKLISRTLQIVLLLGLTLILCIVLASLYLLNLNSANKKSTFQCADFLTSESLDALVSEKKTEIDLLKTEFTPLNIESVPAYDKDNKVCENKSVLRLITTNRIGKMIKDRYPDKLFDVPYIIQIL